MNTKKPNDIPVGALAAHAAARQVVIAYMLKRGIESGALLERVVDVVAVAMRRHGVSEGAKLVDVIAEEQARWRLNVEEEALDDYMANHGSRGSTALEGGGK